MKTKWVEIRHCDFTKGEVLVEGTHKAGTKNHQFRRIPIIPAAKELFQRIVQKNADAKPTNQVLTVHEAQKYMDKAAEAVGIARITLSSVELPVSQVRSLPNAAATQQAYM